MNGAPRRRRVLRRALTRSLRPLRRSAFHVARLALRAAGVRPVPVLLLMGHMRSGSTLLLHILLTHRDVIGRGERNGEYSTSTDLDKLELAGRLAMRAPFARAAYVVDQVNHDRFTPRTPLLATDRVRSIFLVRDPQPTITSLVMLMSGSPEPWSVARAVDYYVGRLNRLAVIARELPGDRWMGMGYDQLVRDTPRTLHRVEAFLGLEGELSEDYSTQTFTGTRGDPSPRIRAGRIVRDATSPAEVEIPPHLLSRAVDAYRQCVEVLGFEPVG